MNRYQQQIIFQLEQNKTLTTQKKQLQHPITKPTEVQETVNYKKIYSKNKRNIYTSIAAHNSSTTHFAQANWQKFRNCDWQLILERK